MCVCMCPSEGVNDVSRTSLIALADVFDSDPGNEVYVNTCIYIYVHIYMYVSVSVYIYIICMYLCVYGSVRGSQRCV